MANGFPLGEAVHEGNINGGSGGHIYIKTAEVNDRNDVSWYSSIDTMGGFGKNKGHGGSGGVIYYDGTFESGIYMAEIAGGLGGNGNDDTKIKGCSNGASGTAYWKGLDELMVDNRNHETDKVTPIEVVNNRNSTDFPDHYMVAMDVYIGRRAILSLTGKTV